MYKQKSDHRLRRALTLRKGRREAIVLQIMKGSIRKYAYVINRKYTGLLRMYDRQDWIQEGFIAVLECIKLNNLGTVRGNIRSYLMGAVRRRIIRHVLNEFLEKRIGYTFALNLNLILLYNLTKPARKLDYRIKRDGTGLEQLTIQKDSLNHIIDDLSERDAGILVDLIVGFTVQHIAEEIGLTVQGVHNILRRKIRPAVKKYVAVE